MSALNEITLGSEVRAVASLGEGERVAMHRLMIDHFEAVPRERFEADLAQKQEVILLRDGAGALRGFTTLGWNPCGYLSVGDVLVSGDTIIDRACWGTQELVRAFCRRAGEWRAASGRRLFWFLISKGHRTYLYLPLFARRFHPHPERPEPEMAALAGWVAAALFGSNWVAADGVIRFPESLGHLRPDLAADSSERIRNPFVRHFLRLNPGYAVGEELVCLTEMSRENLKRVALAAFVEGEGSLS